MSNNGTTYSPVVFMGFLLYPGMSLSRVNTVYGCFYCYIAIYFSIYCFMAESQGYLTLVTQ
jgi:hypothetical protein